MKWTPFLGPRDKIEKFVLIGKNEFEIEATLPRTKTWQGNAAHSQLLSRPKIALEAVKEVKTINEIAQKHKFLPSQSLDLRTTD